MMDEACEVGNEWDHPWCQPCRIAKGCLGLKPMPGHDVFTFQPLSGKRLTIPQSVALDLLRNSGRAFAIEVCDQPQTLIGLWRRGLAKCVEQAPHLSRMSDIWTARPLTD